MRLQMYFDNYIYEIIATNNFFYIYYSIVRKPKDNLI